MKNIENFLGNINKNKEYINQNIDKEIECLLENRNIKEFILKNKIEKKNIIKNIPKLIRYKQMCKIFKEKGDFIPDISFRNSNIHVSLKVKEECKYLYNNTDLFKCFLDIDIEIILLSINKIKKDEKKYLNNFLKQCCSETKIEFLELIMKFKKNKDTFENILLISNDENIDFFIIIYLLWVFLKTKNRIILADFNVLERDFKYGSFFFKEQLIKDLVNIDILLLMDFNIEDHDKLFNNILLNRSRNNKINIVSVNKEFANNNSVFRKFINSYKLLYL